jgi:hypothetical protein
MASLTTFVFYRGSNLVTGGNLVLEVEGPNAIRSGEELILEVQLENRNSADLVLVDLLVVYPPGTRSAADPTQELTRERFSLGEVRSGESREQIVRAIPFGGTESELPFTFTLEYRLDNSNAIFDKTVIHPIKINAVPLSVKLEAPLTVNDGGGAVLRLELASNATVPLPPLLVVVEYPAGWLFREASPGPAADNRLWRLSALAPGESRVIRVEGTLAGQAEEQKFFRVTAGTVAAGRPDQVAVPYGLAEALVTINRPGVGLQLALNGATGGEYVAATRETIRGRVTWVNNLSVPIENAELTLDLVGAAADRTSILVTRGFYQSAAGRIVWSKTGESRLASIPPGATGEVEFSFPVASLTSGVPQINPVITFNLNFRGTQGGTGAAVTAEAVSTVKVNSALQLAAKALQRSGPFANSGPLPPEVGKQTTYTINWSVINSSNNLNNASVKAVLPPYVTWLGVSAPATEVITFTPYSSGGGEIVWQLGQVAAATGLSTAARELSFQLGFLPSSTQVGQIPALVLAPRLSAFDTFTNQTLEVTHREITTFLIADPLFNPGEDEVRS